MFKEYDLHLVQSLEEKLEDLDSLSLNYWLTKFVQEVANKNGGQYPPRSLYGIVCLVAVVVSETLEIVNSAPLILKRHLPKACKLSKFFLFL